MSQFVKKKKKVNIKKCYMNADKGYFKAVQVSMVAPLAHSKGGL